MNCRSCGTPLPQGILYCPSCRKPTPYLIAGQGRASQPAQANNMGTSYGSQQAHIAQGIPQNGRGYPPAVPQEAFPEPDSPRPYNGTFSSGPAGASLKGGELPGLSSAADSRFTAPSAPGSSSNQPSFPPYRSNQGSAYPGGRERSAPAQASPFERNRNQASAQASPFERNRNQASSQASPFERSGSQVPAQASPFDRGGQAFSQASPFEKNGQAFPGLYNNDREASVPTKAMPSAFPPLTGDNNPPFTARSGANINPSFPERFNAFSATEGSSSLASRNLPSAPGDATAWENPLVNPPSSFGDAMAWGNPMSSNPPSVGGQLGQEDELSQFSPYRTGSNAPSYSSYRFNGSGMPGSTTGPASSASAASSFGAMGSSPTTSSFGTMGDSAPVTPFGETYNPSFATSFGAGASSSASRISRTTTNEASTAQMNAAGTMASQQSPFAAPAANAGFVQQYDAPVRSERTSSRLKGWLIIGTIGIVLVLLMGAGGLALMNSFKGTATTGGTGASTPAATAPKTVALSKTVPSIQAIVPSAAAVLSGLQTASAIDNKTLLPTQLTTAFATNQTIYATFFVNSKNQAGFIQIQWYENNQLLAVDKFSHDPQSNVAYFNQQYSAAGDGAIALYWCQKKDCSDGQLAQVVKFNVSLANGTPGTNPAMTPTSFHDTDRRVA